MDISQLQLSPGMPVTSTAADAKPSKIAHAAGQFEALLIGEMLKSEREASDDGWLGGGSDSSAESAFGIAENQLAQTIADHGGLGLAKTIRHALEGSQTSNQSSVQPGNPTTQSANGRH